MIFFENMFSMNDVPKYSTYIFLFFCCCQSSFPVPSSKAMIGLVFRAAVRQHRCVVSRAQQGVAIKELQEQ